MYVVHFMLVFPPVHQTHIEVSMKSSFRIVSGMRKRGPVTPTKAQTSPLNFLQGKQDYSKWLQMH
jgi:hypothetical protein